MSGYDIFKRAVLRLGFADYENRLSSKAIEYCRSICSGIQILYGVSNSIFLL